MYTGGAMAGKIVLFVYGTLKRGGRNHRRLAGCEFVGNAVTVPRYALVDLGPYPGLVTGELAVRGELWAVPADRLPALDAFEGVPDLYTRGPVTLADGSVLLEWPGGRRAAFGLGRAGSVSDRSAGG